MIIPVEKGLRQQCGHGERGAEHTATIRKDFAHTFASVSAFFGGVHEEMGSRAMSPGVRNIAFVLMDVAGAHRDRSMVSVFIPNPFMPPHVVDRLQSIGLAWFA